MTVLNWAPLGRKVKAVLMEQGWDEERFYALAEVEMSHLMDDGLEDPYEVMLHVFDLDDKHGVGGVAAPGKDGPQFIITPDIEEEKTLRVDVVKYVDIFDEMFPDGIPDDHPMMQMMPGGPKGIQMPEPDYDEDTGALN